MASSAALDNAMPVGGLRNIVGIWGAPLDEQGKPKRDAFNAIVTDQVQIALAAAAIEHASGPVRYMAEQYTQQMSHVITIRYQPGLQKGMTVKYEASSFLIQYVLDPKLRHRWLHLLCLEVDS